MNDELRQLVWSRAAGVCEYCRMPQEWDPLPFAVEHIRPQYHHGPTVAENLALSCLQCNCFKGTNAAGYDPETNDLTALYHPREHRWTDHFEFAGSLITGRSPIGRTTVDVMRLNLPERVELRRLLMLEGVFPPELP